ncbi:unnamed protein product [Owenia fusiformis]|uniref:Protein sleepless n=1 Tax=Owenia fusiformis TaxID=6347 RepID=A0A8S4PP40_OWEFU|nr:unnamed protein product [Owenia fusiformis]
MNLVQKMKNTYISGLVLLLIAISTIDALKCYQCSSTTDPDCGERFDHDNVQDLTIKSEECVVDSAQYCVKTIGVWGGVVGTRRFCSSRDMGNQCQYITYADHDRTYRACIYSCYGDHCNSATSSSINKLFMIATIVTGLLWRLL